MRRVRATPETLRARKENGEYDFPKFDTGDGIAIRPAWRAQNSLKEFEKSLSRLEATQERHSMCAPEDKIIAEWNAMLDAKEAAEAAAQKWADAVVQLERAIFVEMQISLLGGPVDA